MGLKNAYLFIYNVVCCLGWASILYHCILSICGGEYDTLWDDVEVVLKVIQTMALLEVMHSVLGIVRSPIFSTIMQVSARLFCLWAVANVSIASRYHWGFAMMISSWALVEVPRYSFYSINLVGKVPSWLFFLRYHMFMVLYPSGFLGEVIIMMKALPYLHAARVYSIQLPNQLNLALSLFTCMVIVLIIYIPGLPIMYSHMLKQKSRAYSKLKSK